MIEPRVVAINGYALPAVHLNVDGEVVVYMPVRLICEDLGFKLAGARVATAAESALGTGLTALRARLRPDCRRFCHLECADWRDAGER
jgi:hypothetical protein